MGFKVLVLGGTRFFCKRLVELLISSGQEVTVASTGKTLALYSKPVKRLIIERTNADSMQAAFKNQTWDVVYDQICFNTEDARIACQVFSNKIGRLIFTSSQSVYDYGTNISEPEFNERTYSGNPNNENGYQEGKRLAEQVYANQDLFSFAAVRFPVVMGSDDHTRRLHWHIARIKFGYPIFFPNIGGKLTIISSNDASAFLHWLIDTRITGPINACSPDPLCLQDFVNAIEKTTTKTLIQTLSKSEQDESSYGVEKDWCASPKKAIGLGYTFKKVTEWLPLLVQSETATATIEDAKVHKMGF